MLSFSFQNKIKTGFKFIQRANNLSKCIKFNYQIQYHFCLSISNSLDQTYYWTMQIICICRFYRTFCVFVVKNVNISVLPHLRHSERLTDTLYDNTQKIENTNGFELRQVGLNLKLYSMAWRSTWGQTRELVYRQGENSHLPFFDGKFI